MTRRPPPRRAALLDEEPEVDDVLDTSEWTRDWTDAERNLWAELLEDADGELQRELLVRALAMGHTAAELHGFADFIRPLSDSEVYAACAAPKGKGHDMPTLLRAQADPLFALELNTRGRARPRRREAPPGPVKLPPALLVDRAVAPVSPREPTPEEAPSEAPAEAQPRPAAPRHGFAEDLFDAAVDFTGIRFSEQPVDAGGLTLEQAVPIATEALSKGIPVPVVLGSRAGDFRRYALILQVQVSGRTRAYQLYDPFEQEAVWANEGDLLSRVELPFSNKVHRRITAIALPRTAPHGVGGVGSGYEGTR